MKVKLTIFIILLVLLSEDSFAQFGLKVPQTLIKDGKFAYLAGYNYNQHHWGELGIVRGFRLNYVEEPSMIAGEMFYVYTSLSSELLLEDEFIMCPKFGYHVVLVVFDLGINIQDYTNFKEHSFGIRPEVGLSFSAILGGYYSYNIQFQNNTFDFPKHNIGVKLMVGTGLFIDHKKREERSLRKQRR